MGSSGGSTTVQKADPWSGQQPYLKEIFADAQKLYRGGQLAPGYYPGQTVAPQNPWTEQALNMQAERAAKGSPSVKAAQAAMDDIAAGRTQTENVGFDFINDYTMIDTLGNDAGYALLQQAAQRSTVPGAGLERLEALAAQDVNAENAGLAALAQMSEAVNPYSTALAAEAAGRAAADIDSRYSRAGRYGSGAHENARAEAVSDVYEQLYAEAYDRQLDAARSAGQLYAEGQAQNSARAEAAAQLRNAGLAQQLSAGQALSDSYRQDWAQKLNAAQNAASLYHGGVDQQISAAQIAQQLANQTYTDAAALSEAGAAANLYDQALIDADVARWNYEQQRPATALNNYHQMIQGNYGGTTSTTSGKTGASAVLGGAASGAALGTSIMPGWGTAIGAGVGGLLSLL